MKVEEAIKKAFEGGCTFGDFFKSSIVHGHMKRKSREGRIHLCSRMNVDIVEPTIFSIAKERIFLDPLLLAIARKGVGVGRRKAFT